MYLKVSQQGPLLAWVLNRPDRHNALGLTLAKELVDQLRVLKQQLALEDPKVPRVLLLSANPSHGPRGKSWIAGGDLRELAQLKTPSDARIYADLMGELCLGFELLDIPVIAAIDGAAIGGGAELALAADLRWATNPSTIDFKQIRLGLSPGYGGATRLIELIGQSRAMACFLTAKQLSAREALDIGLVHELFNDQQSMLSQAQALAQNLAQLPFNSLKALKAMVKDHTHERSERLKREQELFLSLWGNPHHLSILESYR